MSCCPGVWEKWAVSCSQVKPEAVFAQCARNCFVPLLASGPAAVAALRRQAASSGCALVSCPSRRRLSRRGWGGPSAGGAFARRNKKVNVNLFIDHFKISKWAFFMQTWFFKSLNELILCLNCTLEHFKSVFLPFCYFWWNTIKF